MENFDLYDIYEQISITGAESLRQEGKAARKGFPLERHREFVPLNRDPVQIIEAQNQGRISELIPLRQERLSQSAFSFFRGTAKLMAQDLQKQPSTGVHVVICGDAHINNFGFYASPERRLVFDLNDFDEAAPGPWEWDLKRLLTSILLQGEEAGFSLRDTEAAAMETAHVYRGRLRCLLKQTPLERFFDSVDEEQLKTFLHDEAHAEFSQIAKKAKKQTSDRALEKLTQVDALGRRRFIENPPILTHVNRDMMSTVEGYLDAYRQTVRPDVALLLSQGTLTDIARRVVGVGSVGTHCYVAVLSFPDGSRLILQIKEANPSVISQACHPNKTTPQLLPEGSSQGYRVVACQQVLQAFSDPFLGYFSVGDKEFYVRQYRDMKGSIEWGKLSYPNFANFVTSCGVLLARAHSQSPNAYWLQGYLGNKESFNQAIVDWCKRYTQQVQEDYHYYKRFVQSK